MKKIVIIIVVLIIGFLSFKAITKNGMTNSMANSMDGSTVAMHMKNDVLSSWPANATYSVEGDTVTLKDGFYEKPIAPGSVAKTLFRTFGVPTYTDLDGDGDKDAVLFLTKESGNNTFFYVVAGRNANEKYEGSNALLLGDRVSPLSITAANGVVIVTFKDRKTGESFMVAPSVEKSFTLAFDGAKMQISKAQK